MLNFLKRVGSNCAIIDTDDGAIDWVSTEEMFDLVRSGVAIVGVNAQTGEMRPQNVVLRGSLCNWAEGTNIFSNVRSFSISKRTGLFEMRATGRKLFKGRLMPGNLVFNSGVVVQVDWDEWNAILSGDDEKAIATLKNLSRK